MSYERNIMAHLMAKAMSLAITVEIITTLGQRIVGKVTHVERYSDGEQQLCYKVGGSWVQLWSITGIRKAET